MAALAVAGSATGIVTLGIDVCCGIAKYLKAVKDQNDEVAAMNDRIEGLLCILTQISTLLPSNTTSQTPASIQAGRSVEACESIIKDLQALLTKYTLLPAAPKSSQKASTRYIRRAIYPLKKLDIAKLGERLDKLQLNLLIALQAYELSTRLERRPEDDALVAIGQMVAQIRSDTSRIADLPHTIAQMLDEMHGDLAVRTGPRERLHEAASAEIRRIQTPAPNELADLESPLTQHGETVHLASDDITPDEPNHFIAVVDDCHRLKQCSCDILGHNWTWNLNVFSLRSQTSSHQPSCPLYPLRLRHSTMGLMVRFPFSLRTIGAYAALRITRGAGAAIITAALLAGRVVSFENFPSFSLRFFQFGANDAVIIDKLIKARQDIFSAIQCGKLVPSDVDELGRTLLMVVCMVISTVLSRYYTNQVIVAHCRSLLRDVLDMGADPLARSGVKCTASGASAEAHERTAIGFLSSHVPYKPVNEEEAYAYALMFIDITRRSGPIDANPDLVYMSYKHFMLSSALAESIDISSFGHALLQRSIPKLRNALTSDPTCVSEVFPWRLVSAIHIAADWPKGLSLLLDHGAPVNATDIDGNNAFTYAVWCGNSESAKILLDHGSPIFCASDLLSHCWSSEGKYSSKMFNLIVSALVERRQNLQKLFMSSMTLEAHDRRVLHYDRLPDAQAKEAIEMLHQANVPLPIALTVDPHEQPLFSAVNGNWTVSMIKRLWSVGFQDIRQISTGWRLSLRDLFSGEGDILENSLELLAYFVANGVFEGYSEFEERAKLMYLAAYFGSMLGAYYPDNTQFLDLKRIHLALTARHNHDTFRLMHYWCYPQYECSCNCSCSGGGCTVVSTLFRHACERAWNGAHASRLLQRCKIYTHFDQGAQDRLQSGLRRNKRRSQRELVQFFKHSFSALINLDSGYGKGDRERQLERSVLRAIAFEEAGMQHTCCRIVPLDPWKYRAPMIGRIEEVETADLQLYAQFESFISGLVSEHADSQMSLEAFFDGPFQHRIEEFNLQLEQCQQDQQDQQAHSTVLEFLRQDREEDYFEIARVQPLGLSDSLEGARELKLLIEAKFVA